MLKIKHATQGRVRLGYDDSSELEFLSNLPDCFEIRHNQKCKSLIIKFDENLKEFDLFAKIPKDLEQNERKNCAVFECKALKISILLLGIFAGAFLIYRLKAPRYLIKFLTQFKKAPTANKKLIYKGVIKFALKNFRKFQNLHNQTSSTCSLPTTCHINTIELDDNDFYTKRHDNSMPSCIIYKKELN